MHGVQPALEDRAGSLGTAALLESWPQEVSLLLAFFQVYRDSHCSLSCFLHNCMNTISLVFFVFHGMPERCSKIPVWGAGGLVLVSELVPFAPSS